MGELNNLRPDRGDYRPERRMFTAPVRRSDVPQSTYTPLVTPRVPPPQRRRQIVHFGFNWHRTRTIVLGWGLPVFLVLVLLFGLHASVKADPAPTTSELQQYLQTSSLDPYESVAGDYPQVFYQYKQQSVQLTDDNYTHLKPVESGEYIGWEGVINGEGQMFMYDVLNDTLLQLSSASANENLSIYNGTATWDAWDGHNWQIMYYNGTQVQQITNDSDSSDQPSTNGSQIIYAEQISANDWKAQSYDIATGQTTTLAEGTLPDAGYPHFQSDGSVSTSFVPF